MSSASHAHSPRICRESTHTCSVGRLCADPDSHAQTNDTTRTRMRRTVRHTQECQRQGASLAQCEQVTAIFTSLLAHCKESVGGWVDEQWPEGQ